MSPIEFEGLRCHKVTEIIFSIIAVFAWVMLFVICPLPSAWKKIWQHDSKEFPLYVLVALQCYGGFSFVYASHVMVKPHPFHYRCLQYVSLYTIMIVFLYFAHLTPFITESAWETFLVVITAVSITSTLVLIFFLTSDGVMKYVRVASIVFGIFAYASPLPLVIKSTRENTTVPWLPIYLTSAFLLNGLAWLSVSLLQLSFDPYLMITNGVGAILGFLQLGVILRSKLIIKVYPMHQGSLV